MLLLWNGKTLNYYSFLVLTIFILDEGSADLGTGQVGAQPQVCKYVVLLYNSTKYRISHLIRNMHKIKQ